MAKKNLYAVIDTATGIYDGPMPLHSDEQVKRQFIHMATNDENPIGKNPEHFAIIKVGSWNDGTGEVEDYQNHTIMTGLEAVAFSRSQEYVDDTVSPGGTS